VAASFCEELIFREKKMRRLHDHLRHVVDLRWSELRQVLQTARKQAESSQQNDSPIAGG
jgi:hypothetical protein